MAVILKKSINYKGYLLLESIFSLGVLCIIIGCYVSLNGNMLLKKQRTENQLIAYRVLYEEVKNYENGQNPMQKTISRNQKIYQVAFYHRQEKLTKVEISDGQENVSIQKE